MKNILKLSLMAAVSATVLSAADLPYIAPEAVKPLKIQSKITPGGAVEVKLGKSSYTVNADFSLQPGWAKLKADKAEGFTSFKVSGNKLTAAGKDFKLERTIKNFAEAVVVTDRITNTGKEDLPFMYRQYCQYKTKLKEYRLCGYRIYGRRGNGTSSINCTAIMMPPAGGSVGLLFFRPTRPMSGLLPPALTVSANTTAWKPSGNGSTTNLRAWLPPVPSNRMAN